MPTQTPTLAEIFDRATHERMRESFGGWLPARIESYSDSTNRARIQILILDDYEDEEGERQTEAFPVVDDVPIGWLSVGGKTCIRATVSKGDEGIYMMPARPTAKWMQTGGMVDPEDDDHHPLDGGVFLPFRISVGGSNASAMIEITSTEIKAGGTDKVMLKQDGLDFKLALAAAISASSGNAPGLAALTALQTALTTLSGPTPNAGQPWPVCASKLKGG